MYVTDSLRIIAENTAKYAGGNYIQGRYADILHKPKQDNRTGAEIAADVIKKAGLTVI